MAAICLRGREKREGRLKEIHLQEDSRSSNLVILQELEKYGVETGDILPHKKRNALTEENH